MVPGGDRLLVGTVSTPDVSQGTVVKLHVCHQLHQYKAGGVTYANVYTLVAMSQHFLVNCPRAFKTFLYKLHIYLV